MSHTYDFNTWTSFGEQDALPNLPSWVDPDAPAVWAPDVVHLAPGRFIMYFSAALKSNPQFHYLGIASASTVTGPYTPIGTAPRACPTTQGGAIDPAGYYDPADNTRWVVYKIDGNSLGKGGACNNMVQPIVSTPIMLQQVSVDNGFTKIGSPTTLIVNDPADGPYVEAPSLTKMPDGTYVLYYSSNCYTTPLYDVSYATLRNIKGPYKKFGGLLQTGTYGLTAPGGLDLAVNGDHAVFHANWNGGRAMASDMDGERTPASSTTASESAPSSSKTVPGPASQRPADAKVTKSKRSVVHVACACCRRLRIKCDGVRPTCQPCARRYEDCVYDVEANTTRSNALKRKNEELAKENTQLRTLYDFLQNRPLIEAEEIFRRIRSTQDPLEVLRHVTTADLLMAQTTASEKHTQSQDPQGTSSNRNYAPGSGSLKYDPVHDSQ
ncbi:glycoside hydrolase family 43 protein, partial [Aureobasidium melanogenum]